MTHHPGTRKEIVQARTTKAWETPLRRGTDNKWLCRFFTWFWFARENRYTNWPGKVAWVLGPSTFRVDRAGSRTTVWLRGPGCRGYEYHRQVFILIGEWLLRFKWFRTWNRERCSECGHDEFRKTYHDTMNGLTCESTNACTKCGAIMYEFSYGAYASYATSKWEQKEIFLFGKIRD